MHNIDLRISDLKHEARIGILIPALIVCSPYSYSQSGSHAPAGVAEDREQIRIYRNPEERREAGFGTPLTDWLTISGLFEVEKIYRDNQFLDGQQTEQDEARNHTLQVGFEAEFSEALSAELVFEAEYQNRLKTRFEEALLKLDLDHTGLELGYQELPFGEYYSHFISGPLLEFAETSAAALVVDHALADHFEVFGYLFDGKTRRSNKESDIGWGLGFEITNQDESLRAGAGYLSNLAESDEHFLEDSDNIYIDKVPVWNAYALYGFNQFELTAEYVSSIESFSEFETNENKPASVNLELAWFIGHALQLALRIENSDEFADQPEWQYGIAASWRLNEQITVSAEYLRADYKSGFVFDDNDQELEHHDQFGLQISMEF